MVKLASVLAIAVIGRLPSVAAFSPTINAAKIALGQSTSLNYYPDNTFLNYHQGGDFPETQHDISLTYDRAMDCANNFGMCDIDELLDLSEGKFASWPVLPRAPCDGIELHLSNNNFCLIANHIFHIHSTSQSWMNTWAASLKMVQRRAITKLM